MRKSVSDFLAGLGFLVIALAFGLQYGELTGVSRVFPEALITFISLGGLYFVAKGLWFMRKERQIARADAPCAAGEGANAVEDKETEGKDERIQWPRVATIAVLAFVFLLLIKLLGFFSSSAIFLFISAMILGDKKRSLGRRLGVSLAYAVLFNACVWVLFVKLLLVPTPTGLLF